MYSRRPGRSILLAGYGAELRNLAVGPKRPGYTLVVSPSHFEIRVVSSHHITYLWYCQFDLGLDA